MKLGHIKTFLLASVAAVTLASGAASAADVSAAAPVASDKHEWDVAFGVTFTSDYISRGYTGTNGGAAVQPWAELTINDWFYVGYWGSNVTDGTNAGWESDLSIGVRPTLGPVSFDFGYTRYLYSNQNFLNDYGEVYAKASFSPVDPVTLGGSVYYDPTAKNVYLEANASVDLHHNVSASGAVGWQSYGNNDPTDFSWNAGLSWAPQDWVKLDGRYYGGPTANKWVAAITFQSSAKALGIIH